ncbi:MAG: hypothetical protein E7299_04975 [Lachnospiraceae bacterium]|nr:hypothetical protein [Lachnospiraceae bacterium]
MTKPELNNAIDSVIDQFEKEASKSLEYQDDYGKINSDAIIQQNTAIKNAMVSLKKILLADKEN